MWPKGLLKKVAQINGLNVTDQQEEIQKEEGKTSEAAATCKHSFSANRLASMINLQHFL